MAVHYLTKEKHAELTQELETLVTVRRPEIAQQLEYARSLGDLSENAEYQQARTTQGEVEGRIKYLALLLKKVEIIAPHHSESVEVGSTVTVKKAGDEKREFAIVGSEEADTAAGRISPSSPLGRAMMGKKKGDTFTMTTPAGKTMEYTVVKID
ncbi:MAG: transcription elongation factor GreA [Patescibacteria group bacterium]